MGFLDFLLTPGHKRETIAKKIGIQAGIFQECHVCREVTDTDQKVVDNPSLDKAIEEYVASGDPNFSLFENDVTALRAFIIELAKKLPFDCICHRA